MLSCFVIGHNLKHDTITPNRNSRPIHLLCQSYRESDKLKNYPLANLNKLPFVPSSLYVSRVPDTAYSNCTTALIVCRLRR